MILLTDFRTVVFYVVYMSVCVMSI
jgi:hypothetical protein